MIRDQTKLDTQDQQVLAAINARSEVVSCAHDLTQAFTRLMRERQPQALEPWFQSAKTSGLPDFVTFARGLERDVVALKAALLLRWSNGPVEGIFNNIKLIKRQAYGRASFQLLRQRVLMAMWRAIIKNDGERVRGFTPVLRHRQTPTWTPLADTPSASDPCFQGMDAPSPPRLWPRPPTTKSEGTSMDRGGTFTGA
ncbi:transposase [Deinococcus ruber]|uniref:Transposase IS204/IS1001/IS1096/IS1165 DDE domain-containing protein n=1 Tax=Deinococcus ruber TaxID=1848197 RepID=A0A918FDE1_9DEIO|nr:hypothetical protein GCM10008957_49130 [Deinococcus ruber]